MSKMTVKEYRRRQNSDTRTVVETDKNGSITNVYPNGDTRQTVTINRNGSPIVPMSDEERQRRAVEAIRNEIKEDITSWTPSRYKPESTSKITTADKLLQRRSAAAETLLSGNKPKTTVNSLLQNRGETKKIGSTGSTLDKIMPSKKVQPVMQKEMTAAIKKGTNTKWNNWLNQRVDDTLRWYESNFMPADVNDYKGAAEDYFIQQKMGKSNTGDIRTLGDNKLFAQRYMNEKLARDAKAKEEAYANLTEEEKQGLRNTAFEKNVIEGKYEHLRTEGVPYGTNKDGLLFSVGSDADQLAADGYLKKRPDDYWDGNKREDYDRVLYDYMNGEGSYMAAVDKLETDRDVEQFEAGIDALWKAIETGKIDDAYNYAAEESSKANQATVGDYGSTTYTKKAQQLAKEMERRKTVKELESGAPAGNSEYSLENITNRVYDEVDGIYYWANNLTDDTNTMGEQYANMRPEQFMTQEQLDVFNSYYNAGDKESAKAYYDALLPYLRQIKNETKNQYAYTMSQNEWAPLMIGQRILTQPAAGLAGTAGAFMALLGNEDARDPDSGYYDLTRLNQTIQGARAKQWGKQMAEWFGGGDEGTAAKFGEWLNGAMYSMIDSLEARAIGMGIGGVFGAGQTSKLAGNILQFVMSSESTASEMYNNLTNNMDPTEAVLRAFGSGIIEWATEKYSTDRFFENYGKGNFWQQALANVVPEAQEEGASKILGSFMDDVLSPVFGHESEFQAKKNAYQKQLGDDPDADKKAFWMALRDYGIDLGAEMAAGGLTGGIMGGGGAAMANVTNYNADVQTGNETLNYGLETESQENGKKNNKKNKGMTLSFGQGQNLLNVLEAAEKMDVNSKSAELAAKLWDKVNNGKENEITPREVGELVRTIIGETGEGIGNTVRNSVAADVQVLLEGQGNKNAEKLSGIVAKAIAGEELTRAELFLLYRNDDAKELVRQYGMGFRYGLTSDAGVRESIKGIDEETKNLQEARESMMEMLGYEKDAVTEEEKTAAEERAEQFMASDVEIEEAQKERAARRESPKQMQPRYDATERTATEQPEATQESGTRRESPKQMRPQNEATERSATSEETKAEETGKRLPVRMEEGETQRPVAVAGQETKSGTAGEAKTQPNVIVDGIYRGIQNIISTVKENADGVKMRQTEVVLDNGETVSISDVKADNEAVAAVLAYAADNGTNLTGSEFLTEMVRAAEKLTNVNLKDAAQMIKAMTQIRLSAYFGINNTNKSSLPAEVQEELQQAAQEEYEEAEKERTENGRTINPGQGQTNIGGVYYGTNEFSEKLNSMLKGVGRNMAKTIRNEAETIAQIAKDAGFDVELYYDNNSREAQENQGEFSTSGGVRINLAGVYNTEGAHRSALATFAHEVTHWLEANSQNAYRDLRNFVVKTLTGKGYNIENRLTGIIQRYSANNVELDLAGAVAELVAKSSEEIFLNDEVIGEIRQQNPGLMGKIKEAVTELVNRIKNMSGLIRGTSSIYAGAMNDVAEEYGKKWIGAYQEAAGRTGTASDQSGNEYSFMGTDAESGASIYMSNYPEGTPKTDKQKDFINNIQNVFSKQQIKLELNGFDGKGKRTIYARFDPTFDSEHKVNTDAGKLAYNKKVKSNPENRVRLNLAGDLQQILSESYNYNSMDDKKNDPSILQWHYFMDHIYYVAQGSDVMEPYKIDISIKEKSDGTFVYTYEAIKDQNRKEKKLSLMEKMSSVNTGTNSGESASASKKSIAQKQGGGNSQKSLAELDEEYANAVERGDWRTAENMLLEKARSTRGITGYKAAHFYNGEHKAVARMIKENYGDAVATAVNEMAPMIPENAVLIPMPPHEGIVTNDTDTMILAQALSEATGAPVINALESDYHESRYKAKAEGNRNVNAETMGFRQVEEIPEDAMPVFIDNMVGGGQTAMAAKNAIGRGFTLAYAQSSRAKSQGVKALTVTYDENGKLIPLSQRMDPNNKSWKYSLQETDEEYMQAVNSGDMETAQRIVDEAAQAAGYTIKGTHRTNAKFTVFEKSMQSGKNGRTLGNGFYVAAGENTEYDSDTYGKNRMLVYINPGKVFNLTEGFTKRQANRIYEKYFAPYHEDTFNTYRPHVIEKLQSPLRVMDYIDEAAETNNTTTDEIFKWLGYNSIKDGPQYAVFDSEQIKSADAVVYDDDGNVIPPSERFNKKSNDIRFSMTETVEENADGLIAVHNLSEEQLMQTLQLGGFAMPSIAIIRNDYAHNRYGDISVVFYPNTIDPRASKSNKVYGGDAWTPTYPTIEYKISNKAIDNVLKKVNKLVPENIRKGLSFASLDETNLTNAVNSARGDIVKAVKDNKKLRAAFLEDTGKPIQYPMQEKKISRRFSNELIEKVLDTLGNDIVTDAYYNYNTSRYLDEHPEVSETIRQIVSEDWKEQIREKLGSEESKLKIAKLDPYSKDNWGFSHSYDAIEGAWKLMKRGNESEVDERALDEILKNEIDEEKYEKWLKELFSGAIEKKGIRNNKDLFTNSGNRRSWEALHEEETLENVVRVMKNEISKGSNTFFSQSEMLAIGTRDLKSLNDIRKHKNQLQHISDEEMSAAKTNIVNQFGELMDEMKDPRERNEFIARDRALQAMVEAVRRSRTPQGILRELRQWYGLKVTEDMGQRIADLMEKIADLPTEYFEAKPQRAVTFDEIEKVILPETASTELTNALEARNIPYETYDGTDEDRLRALNEQTDAQFSFMDESEYDVSSWMETVPEWSLGTEAEKELQRQYKGLRMKLQLKMEDVRKWSAEVKRLEAIPEAQRDKDTKRKLKAYRIRVQNAQTVVDELQTRIGQITSNEGYAGIMYRQQKIMQDFLYGRSQAEVQDAVNALQDSAENIAQEIEENRKAIRNLESTDAVKRVKKMLGTTKADTVAMKLKKMYNSTWTANEIKTMLDPIIAKMLSGQDFEQDVQQLAENLIASDRRNTYEGLEDLRGLTITLGPGAMKELRGQNSSLKEVRRRLIGTGIKVVSGERSTLEADIEDLQARYPGMPDMGSDKDALENFLTWVEGMKDPASQEFYNERLAQAMANVMQQAAIAASDTGMVIPSGKAAQRIIQNMVEFVKSMQAQTKQAEEALAKAAEELNKLRAESGKAAGMASAMTGDISQAIEYYNKMAQEAVLGAKRNRQTAIIEQLKSEQAQKILRNNEEWRNLIERDKQAAMQLDANNRRRNVINTDIKRLMNLLKNPKGLQNITEYMQGAAREMIETFVNNDLEGGRRLTKADKKQLREAQRLLNEWKKTDGGYNKLEMQLGAGSAEVADVIDRDLEIIDEALKAYNGDIRGKNKLDIMQQRGAILEQMQEAVSEIYNAIRAEGRINILGHAVEVLHQADKIEQATGGKRKEELTGALGGAIRAMHKAIVSGNMTPEYFFRTLGNKGLTEIWEGYHDAENRNGLELAKAKARLEEIAARHGYNTWDTKQKITVQLHGGDVQMTLGQIMSLYATWKREQTLGPAMSEHLKKGGFYVEQDMKAGILGKAVMDKKAHRVNEADMAKVGEILSEEQKAYINDIVDYMSTDMSELGNDASMKAYGIKMYKETYYFPFKIWDGIKNLKSNDAGNGANGNQAFHPSFSKSRLHGASNALMLGDFTETAADHIVGMINYATMGLANDNLNKVLNFQIVHEGQSEDETFRNVRAIIEEAYGQEVLQYLMNLRQQLEGGAVRTESTFGDKLISMFRKNAVAGSLSVAAQQPLSYIRAATMISPKYLVRAISPDMWKGSYQEMMAHSGVAVIKDMGRFDMSLGQSGREYIQPEGKKSTAKKTWDFVTDKSTILPELMDKMTWTRMWCAVKAEQHAQNPNMDVKSDVFLDMVGERFNDLMRRTQVYDSTLVKSANMRSKHYWVKQLTSFMAEPTLTANVLMDAARSAIQGEKGGKALLAKAGATFMLGAVLQAAIKAMSSTGRSPDDKKTWEENFYYRFGSYLMSEADPLSLIPGYSELVTLLKDGEIQDDAMGAIGKIFTAGEKGLQLATGKSKNGFYRDVEDSAGQLIQIFTNLPLKNLMRDARAMWNWAIEQPYADRETSKDVLKYQTIDNIFNADNLIGAINTKLGEAGYDTSTTGYYKRVYEATKAGNEEEAQSLIDYLLKGKGVKDEKTITSEVNSLAKKDDSLSAEEKIDFLSDNGYGQMGSYIVNQYAAGELTREEAEKLYKEQNPKATDKTVMAAFDKADYEAENGDIDSYSNYTPLYEAMEAGDVKAANAQRAHMKTAGYTDKDINAQMKTKIKEQYIEGTINRTTAERRLRDFAGMNAEEAKNTIDNAVGDAIMEAFQLGTINRKTAESRLQKEAGIDAETAWWKVDKAEYQKNGGQETSDKYYRFNDAIKKRASSTVITKAVQDMLAHGMTEKQIRNYIANNDYGYKDDYLQATGNDKVRLKQALIVAYKAIGISETEANNIINKWK